MNAILLVAGKEFRDGLRNRWALAITVVFALLAVGIAYFGAAASGTVGFTSLASTIVSLSSLAVFVIPLIALMLAYDSIVGEDERGTLLLLMTYPLSRPQLLLGKFAGHAATLALATVVGFGLAIGVILLFAAESTPAEVLPAFAFFVLSAILLGWVFIALAFIISAIAVEKSRAAGLALIVWFLFVLVFDLALLGLLVGTEGRIDAELFRYLLLLNPTDVFRLANMSGFEAAAEVSGLASVAAADQLSAPALLATLVAWIMLPLSAAAALFARRRT